MTGTVAFCTTARISVIQAVDIGQHDEQIGLQKRGHNGGQGVVVSKVGADQLVDRYRVVLINHGDDPHFQQGGEGVEDILLGVVVFHDIPGEQDLRHRAVVLSKQLVVYEHQLALPNRRDGLLFTGAGGAHAQTELTHSDTDGTGADQDDFLPGILQIAQHLAQGFDGADVQFSILIGEGRGSDLDHHPLRRGDG